MRMVDLIEKKQNHETLTTAEIDWLIDHFTTGEIPDYQMSAFAMAVYFNEMTAEELSDFTMAMVNSGETIDLSDIAGIKVDKHSTGGVGDTTTLVLIPLVASLGIPVAKMSGRGLGHTGGTLDKLEAIPGFHIEISQADFIDLVNTNKLALAGQSGNLTPADKKLYALRDVTGTVNSIPLIASSIMSKKIASGADAIVLDVKTGAGAFMKELDRAEELARTMVNIGVQVNRQTMAVISDMSQPLGYAIGNGLEVKEAIDTLRGEGPEDLTELCLELGAQMAYLSGEVDSIEEAKERMKRALTDGTALEKFREFVVAQGGDGSVVDEPDTILPQAATTVDVNAKESGVVSEIVADKVGTVAMILGAGRETKDSAIDLSAGIVLHKKVGDEVEAGEALATLYTNKSAEVVEEATERLLAYITIADEASKPTLIHRTVTAE